MCAEADRIVHFRFPGTHVEVRAVRFHVNLPPTIFIRRPSLSYFHFQKKLACQPVNVTDFHIYAVRVKLISA